MKDFIEYIFHQITVKPEEVVVEETTTNETVNFTITVAQEDIPFVIGKMGKNIKSVRSLARAKAMKSGLNKQIYIDIKDQTAQA